MRNSHKSECAATDTQERICAISVRNFVRPFSWPSKRTAKPRDLQRGPSKTAQRHRSHKRATKGPNKAAPSTSSRDGDLESIPTAGKRESHATACRREDPWGLPPRGSGTPSGPPEFEGLEGPPRHRQNMGLPHQKTHSYSRHANRRDGTDSEVFEGPPTPTTWSKT